MADRDGFRSFQNALAQQFHLRAKYLEEVGSVDPPPATAINVTPPPATLDTTEGVKGTTVGVEQNEAEPRNVPVVHTSMITGK